MKTIKVLVDELPISCANCRYSEHFYFYGRNWEFCKMADINPVRDIENKRANGCPLALEHDNKQIAKEVM